MRPVSAQWASTVTSGVHEIVCSAQGWMHGEPTFNIPVIDGQIVYDITARGNRRLSMTIPLVGPDGFRWDPGSDPSHPLATYGQQIRVQLGVRHPDGTAELLAMGFFLVAGTTTDEERGTVQVAGSDLIEKMTESKILLQPDSVIPLPTDTHLTALQKLMWVALHSPTLNDPKIMIDVYDTLPVSELGGTTTIRDGEDRVALMQQIADSWPARMYVDDSGRLHFSAPITGPKTTPDVTVTANQNDSTLISQGHQQDRRRAYNSVRVTSLDSATGEVLGTALAYVSTGGPLDVRGVYGWITRWYQSPYALNNTQAMAVAKSMLTTGTLYTRTERVTCAPNAAIELGDTVRVIGRNGTFTGIAASIVIPLTAAGGSMAMDITTDIEGT